MGKAKSNANNASNAGSSSSTSGSGSSSGSSNLKIRDPESGYSPKALLSDTYILAAASFVWAMAVLPSGGAGRVFWTWWLVYLSGAGQVDSFAAKTPPRGVREGAVHGLMWAVLLPMMLAYSALLSEASSSAESALSPASTAALWAAQLSAVWESFVVRRGKGNLLTTAAVPLFFGLAFWKQAGVFPLSIAGLVVAVGAAAGRTLMWNELLKGSNGSGLVKGSFTIGEAGLVSAGVAAAGLELAMAALGGSGRSVEGLVGTAAVFGTLVALAVASPYWRVEEEQHWGKVVVGVALGAVTPVVTLLNGGGLFSVSLNPFVVVLGHVFASFGAVLVVVWDAAVVAGTVAALADKKRGVVPADWPLTFVRKIFHALVVAVAVPTLLVSPVLAGLAGACVLPVLLVVEAVRVGGLGGARGKALREFMARFVDSREGGQVYLTHLYLLLGIWVPIWFALWAGVGSSVVAFAGVVCLGIGDSAASYVGVRHGKTPVAPGSKKTLEGVAGGAAANFAAVIVLSVFGGWSFGLGQWMWIAVSCGVVAVAEGATDQIDNLVLPGLFAAMLYAVVA